MQKVLFIDRDGTLIKETADEQIDAFEKMMFYPKVFSNLSKIAQLLNFELVMITNQDGLGTEVFPEATFWPVHHFILQAFKNEGVLFDAVYIDRTYPHQQANTRKPGTGLLTKYFSKAYDLKNSFVIGDRLTDIELAKNLGAKGIFINEKTYLGADEITSKREDLQTHIALESTDWSEIWNFLSRKDRISTRYRQTNETEVEISINLDGTGKHTIHTGIAFFDHMLAQLSKHGQIDLDIRTKGDLEVDAHHTIEDTAIALGECLHNALGNKMSVERYGYCLPMDDCLAQVAVDFGGRSWLVWEPTFQRENIGAMPTEMFSHFFKSFCDGAKANLNIKAEGTNEHHKIEAIFKAFAKALKSAIHRDTGKIILPSTKGVL